MPIPLSLPGIEQLSILSHFYEISADRYAIFLLREPGQRKETIYYQFVTLEIGRHLLPGTYFANGLACWRRNLRSLPRRTTEGAEKRGKKKIDELVKSPKVGFSVIPAKAGIQFFPPVMSSLDSGFHRSDDFLRNHQNWKNGMLE